MRHSRCCKKPLWRQPMLRSQLPRTHACVLRSTTATTVSDSVCLMLSDPHPPSVSSVSSVSRAPRASSIAPISPVSPLSSTRLVSSATSVSPSAACLSPLLRRRFLPSPFYLHSCPLVTRRLYTRPHLLFCVSKSPLLARPLSLLPTSDLRPRRLCSTTFHLRAPSKEKRAVTDACARFSRIPPSIL